MGGGASITFKRRALWEGPWSPRIVSVLQGRSWSRRCRCPSPRCSLPRCPLLRCPPPCCSPPKKEAEALSPVPTHRGGLRASSPETRWNLRPEAWSLRASNQSTMEDNGNNEVSSPGAAARPRRVLVTGGAGMLGSQVLLAVPDDIEALGTDMREAPGVDMPGVDLTDDAQVEALFDELAPIDWRDPPRRPTPRVDRAEEEPELAQLINGDACGVLARAAAKAGIPLVLVSTDFVFDGQAKAPYSEGRAHEPAVRVRVPPSWTVRPRALAAHPEGAKVVRTQWLYGPRGSHFPPHHAAPGQGARPPQGGQRPGRGRRRRRWSSRLRFGDVLISGEPGVWHAACAGECSWFDLAVATIEASEIEGVEVEPCSTDEFPRPAAPPGRPTALSTAPSWSGSAANPWRPGRTPCSPTLEAKHHDPYRSRHRRRRLHRQ